MTDVKRAAKRPPIIAKRTAPPVFIHSAHRTSSTWFWAKFRENPATLCFYEPSNFVLNWLTKDAVSTIGPDAWDSRHPPIDPYLEEYVPLIRASGGVELFDPAMTMRWFLPQGGLRGALRPREHDYLAMLVRHADAAGKVPVFGDCWSLGRCWAIREALGGCHIFQHRNLWQQWLSFLSYKQTGNWTFYVTVMDLLCRDDDAFFAYLVERGLKHAAQSPQIRDKNGGVPPNWRRLYVNLPRDEAKVRKLELMPEHHVFTLFMGLHIYLYLHAQLSMDLAADVTRMARDQGYRSDIERAIERQTGLAVSFADVADVIRPGGLEIDTAAIDWDEIREDARVAVSALSAFADAKQLTANATAFIDATIDEMRRSEAAQAAPPAPDLPGAEGKEDAARAKTIGLCMIVKNETKVIRRCLESALPLVDHILVVDTGSTDGTQQVIRDFLAEHTIKGAVIEEPWRDFAYNRTFALERLREVADVDYAMIIDADDVVELDAGFDPKAFKLQMTHDLYDVPIRYAGISYSRPQICSNRVAFSFKGVLHEYLEGPPGGFSRADAKGFAIRASTGGARSENPRKYQDDAAVLERALTTEADPFLISRYTFYLAQSYRDCGERENALDRYLKRAELGYWIQEVYVSLLEAGNLMAALDHPFEEVIAVYERASRAVPARAEALHAASFYCRKHGKNAEGQEFARRSLELAQPANGLFIRPWVYDYGTLDEFAINAYWAGAYRESLDASLKLLASDKLPPGMVQRLAANARFAAGKMPAAKPPNLGTLGGEDFIHQHKLVPERKLRSHVADAPRVLVAILAKQKEAALPLYLQCIEALDYPKSSIVLYIRTNNNTDRTEQILREWVARVSHLYQAVEFDASDVSQRVEQFGEHEWNATRFGVLARIRNESMRRAVELGCDYYFVADVDNFVRPATLRELAALDLPIVAPLLRLISPNGFYSNYHADIDANGYYKNCDQYYWILSRHVRGIVEVPVVHCTYLVRADVIPEISYEDKTGRHEYVVFADSARKAGVPQYIDNRQVYGYITFGEGDQHHESNGIERARALIANAGDRTMQHSNPGSAKSDPARAMPIYLINLDRSSERLAEFQKRNAHLTDVIRVSGVEGASVDKARLVKDGIITEDLSYPPGTLGCALSHIGLWKKAVSENTIVTVFEDDAIASFKFEQGAAKVMATLPEDWDLIKWGHAFEPWFVWLDLVYAKATLHFYDRRFTGHQRLKFQSADFSPSAIRHDHSFGTQAYSISPKGARALLEYCVPLRKRTIQFPGAGVAIDDTGIDCAVNGAYNLMKTYICIPPLVLHDEEQASERVGRNNG